MERVDADLVPFAQNNPSGYRFAFGTDTATDDINVNYNDNIKKGWGTTPNEFPEVEDFNAFAYTSGYLTAYLYQMGIAEWNNKQKYKKYSRVIGSDGKTYKAKTGTDLSPNVDNNPTTDTTNWEDVLDNYVATTGNQTIAGIKTFSSSPIVPTPTTSGNVITMDNIIQKTDVGIGYGSGSGGTVTQLTSKSTAVTLNKPTGRIIMNNAALSNSGYVGFTLNNNTFSSDDNIIVNVSGGAPDISAYEIRAVYFSANTAGIYVKNVSAGSLSDALQINFTILKGANS